jgi:hypothetical protein
MFVLADGRRTPRDLASALGRERDQRSRDSGGLEILTVISLLDPAILHVTDITPANIGS